MSSYELELKDDFDEEPEVENCNGDFGDFQLVGHGKVTNEYCGRYIGIKGCLNVDLHNIVTLDGKNYKGKIYRKFVYHFCNKPSCPVCYKKGWAVRQAHNIESRLAEASKRFGQVEHIVATVPPKFYCLSYSDLRKKMRAVLARRGVIGGVMIFHGFRFNLRRYWYWSPHFHVLGFILGGYKCRTCEKIRETGKCGIENRECSGFVNRNYRCYEKDGCIVKVMGKRKTVGGTAWYQLNHSSVDRTKKRFHVSIWFGVCSYRKLKVTVEKRRSLCPLCKYELIDIQYNGKKRLVTDRNSPDFKRESFEDFIEDGLPAWSEKVKKSWG